MLALKERTHIRKARKRDSRRIAELFRVCSGGVADYLWHKLCEPGQSPLEAGTLRYARNDTPFSYRNCIIAERDGAVAGMLHAYPIEAKTDGHEDIDPVLRPYAELEILGSLYLSGMAVYPAYRNLGIGSRLLALARERARVHGLGSLSALVFEQNAGSLRLLAHHGFREVDRRPVVAHELLEYDGDVLLVAGLPQSRAPAR